MKQIKIIIELDERETAHLFEVFDRLLQSIVSQAPSPVPDTVIDAEVPEEPDLHDCLDCVEVEYVEDYEGEFHVVNCAVCGCDVSEKYEATYGSEEGDYDSSKEFKAEEGWWL